MESRMQSCIVGVITVALLGSLGVAGIAKADPGPGQGDPSFGTVLLLVDRSGSMSGPGKNCYDENGATITDPIRKWECAVKAAKFRMKNADSATKKRYFVWLFASLYDDPTHPVVWSIDKNGAEVKDGVGKTLPAAVSDALALSWDDLGTSLTALDKPTSGPVEDDARTPLAGAYCTAVQALKAYRGDSTDLELSILLESDGFENDTPTTMVCKGDDGLGTGYTYSQGDPKVADLTLSTGSPVYILTADGIMVPSWQSNMLDVAITNEAHTPDATGKVLQSTKAFSLPPGGSNVLTNINFIQDFIESSATFKTAAPGRSDFAPAAARMSLVSATAPTDPNLLAMNGLAQINGGRLIAFGTGEAPTPGDPNVPHAVPGDINDDGCVDLADYSLLKTYYNQNVSPSRPQSFLADINYDSKIDIGDYFMMKANYGRGCTTSPGTLPVLPQTMFGFDDIRDWASAQAALSLVALPRTEGSYAVSVGGAGYRTISSIRLSTPFQGVTSHVALDVALPKSPSNPYWLGQVLLFVSCPSANINNQAIGTVELAGKPLGKFSTIKFAIPATVRAAMLAPHPDFSFSISLNANDPGYQLDNLRFVP